MSKMHKKLKKNFDLEKNFDPCDLDLHPVTLTLLWHVDLAYAYLPGKYDDPIQPLRGSNDSSKV